MAHSFVILLLLLTALCGCAVIARRLELAPAIVFLVGGIMLALVPGLPRVEMQPQGVLLIVLPPVIYWASVSMSWREFRANLRPIALLAIGCVVFTTCAVAMAAHWLLGLSWGVGFVLGAIVSPPDVVAPLAIARRLRLPQRILVILEGEGLANDATALILYRFAVLTVTTGSFSLPVAAGSFATIVAAEVVFGTAIGWISLRLRQWADEPRIEIALSLLTPYAAFWVPEHFGGSGVLATVAAGLYVSWNGPLLIPAATRLQGTFFWDFVSWLIEGILFLAAGFQMRLLMDKAKGAPLGDVLAAVALVSAIVILARFLWVVPGTLLTRVFGQRRSGRSHLPSWAAAFLIGFTGIRGVVSLAVALALPLTLPDGSDFPDRDLILFVSFGVICVTLVGIGLTLPWVVEVLGLSRHGRAEAEHERVAEIAARREILQAARRSLKAIVAEREVPEDVVRFLESRHETRMRALPAPPHADESAARTSPAMASGIVRELIAGERELLHKLLRQGKITAETRRRIERDLDLEEAATANNERMSGECG